MMLDRRSTSPLSYPISCLLYPSPLISTFSINNIYILCFQTKFFHPIQTYSNDFGILSVGRHTCFQRNLKKNSLLAVARAHQKKRNISNIEKLSNNQIKNHWRSYRWKWFVWQHKDGIGWKSYENFLFCLWLVYAPSRISPSYWDLPSCGSNITNLDTTIGCD